MRKTFVETTSTSDRVACNTGKRKFSKFSQCSTEHPQAPLVSKYVTENSRHPGCFLSFLKAQLPRLTTLAAMLTGDSDLADDLVQETMIMAWQQANRFDFSKRPAGLLGTMLRRRRIDADRKSIRARKLHELYFVDEPIADDCGLGAVHAEQLAKLIGKLAPNYSAALTAMADSGDTALPELAAEIGWPVGTLKTRVRRARQAVTACGALAEGLA